MPSKKNSKSKSKAQSFPDVDEALNRLQPEKRLQNERKALRKQITLHCNSIMSLIEEKKSRSTVKALLIESEEFLKRTVAINLELINSVSTQESSDQQTKHTKYLTLIGDTRQAVEDYLEARRDDASSVVTVRSQSNQERLKQLDDAKREAEQAFKLTADKEQEAADAKKAADLASRKLHQLGLGDGSSASSQRDFRDDASITSATHFNKYRPVDNQSDFSASNLGPLPDDWIVDYVNGFSSSQIWNYLSSSLGADLPMYSGEVLQYFAFVDMFKSLVHCTSRSPAEKLAILKSRLRGPCFDAVKHLSGGEDAYKEALRRFKKRFGDRDLMRMTHKLALERLEYRRGDNSAFVQFAEEVRTHLFELGRLGERQNTHLIENVCSKLTHSDRLAWNERRGDAFEYRTVEEFSDWLCNRASSYLNLYSLALEQVNGRQGKNQNNSRFASNSQTPRDKNRTHATTNAIASNEGASQKNGSKKSSPFCFKCDKDGHRLTDCNAFKKMKIVDRVKFVKEHALCFVCCGTKHKSIACHFKKPCVVSGCRLLHHILLHEDEPVPSKPETRSGTSEVVGASTGSTQIESNKIAFCVTQVEVFAADGSIVPATVFIDSGSDSTLIREGFARRLNLEGKKQTLKVDGIGTKCSTYNSQKLNLRLLVGSDMIDLTGSTMPKLTRPVPVRDWESLKEKWSHLRDLPLKPSGGEVDILIGLDHRHLSAVLDSRIGSEGQPIAERNKLGWVVSGVIGEQTDTVAVASHSVFTSFAPEEDALLKQVKVLCDSENFGTEYKTEENLSESEKYAVNYFETNTVKLPVGYESKPIWKPGEPNLHNNYYQALNRFRGLQRRFNRDPKFKKDYFKAMSKYADKNFSRRVEDWNPNDPDQCLLCHSGVYKNQQDQLNGKLRIVFDAACPHRGKSINDCLETGPCLLEPLPSVFRKFCEGEVAWAADVGSFFSKVRIPASDTKYFRYIWKPEGAEEDEIWEKVVLPFGIKPAPYMATAVARKAAVDSGATDKTLEAIKKRMYVDDYASSAHTVTESLEEATAVDTALKSGDFILEGWVSNSSEFLRRIGAADQPVVDAKILGIGWNVKEDTIQISSVE